MTDKNREEFEVWALTRFINSETMQPLVRCESEPDDYRYSLVNMAWVGWQASREALVIELPPEPTVPDEPEEAIDDSFMDSYYAAQGMRNDCAQLIEAAGLKVKP